MAQHYRVFVPKQAVGASLIYFDIFHPASSGKQLEVLSCIPVVSGAVAVTGTLGVDLYLTRTSAVGTGGTTAVANSTSQTAMSINALDCEQVFDASFLSGRLTPSGGATGAAILNFASVFTEETNSAAYTPWVDMAVPPIPVMNAPTVIVPQGTGISVVQGGVASVGNIGFNLLLRVSMKSQ